MKDYEKMVNCNDTYCEYFDERMELHCAYSEDNSECIKTIEPLSSHAVLGEVRAKLQRMIDFEKENTKNQPWMRQAQYRLSGLEDAITIIDDKIREDLWHTKI